VPRHLHPQQYSSPYSDQQAAIISSSWGILYPASNIPAFVGSPLSLDPNCRTFTNGTCSECSSSSYFVGGVCTQIDPYCQSFNRTSSTCSVCYQGYAPSGPTCYLSPNSAGSLSGVCPRRQVNINGICTAVSDQCKDWNALALCTACYLGYSLFNGTCF
jgi:hypothetical protein